MTGSCLLLGPPGAGKTSSLRNLAKSYNQQTFFINAERKDCPFPEQFTKFFRPKTTKEIFETYKQLISKGKEKGIKVVALDSFSAFADTALYESRLQFTGFDIWSNYNEKIGTLFMLQKDLVDEGIHSIMIAHDELTQDEGGTVVGRRVKTKGKEWSGIVEKEFNVCLWTESVPDETKTDVMNHTFVTQSNSKHPAKSPIDMLPLRMENDMYKVIQALDNYGKEKTEK